MSEYRILVLTALWPHLNHSIRAANVVTFELIAEMARFPGIQVGLLKLNDSEEDERNQEEDSGIRALEEIGVDVLEPLYVPKVDTNRNKWERHLFPKLLDFYPQVGFKEHIEGVIKQFRPDMLFIPWSEWITAVCADVKIPKFAYYGNPDPKSALARLNFARKHGRVNSLRYLLSRRNIRQLERLHLDVMRKYELLGDVAKNDAEYYSRCGHPNSFYIQNVWIDRMGPSWESTRAVQADSGEPAIIIANVGKLGGTANTMGLEILGRDVIPRLRERMKPGSYEIRILGAGSLDSAIARYFDGSDIDVAGFVHNIDDELLGSTVFLCTNNASSYKVGHTRYLHAWSLGCCVVAHADCVLSMPEIENGRNALLGRDADEIAELLQEALVNEELRLTVGQGGYETFKEAFTADRVVLRISQEIDRFFQRPESVDVNSAA